MICSQSIYIFPLVVVCSYCIHVKRAKEHTLCSAFLPSCYRAEHIRALCSTPGLEWKQAQTNSSAGLFYIRARLLSSRWSERTRAEGQNAPFIQDGVSSGSRCGSAQAEWRFTIMSWNSLKQRRSSVNVIPSFREP